MSGPRSPFVLWLLLLVVEVVEVEVMLLLPFAAKLDGTFLLDLNDGDICNGKRNKVDSFSTFSS